MEYVAVPSNDSIRGVVPLRLMEIRRLAGTGPAGGMWIKAKNEFDCGATSALIFDN